jgi:prepilin-type N-terminal cleavage/methylation domain-containing protein/prepilin-type processing-associated H-X9-DG protein
MSPKEGRMAGSGFTLVELLVAIAILALLSSLAYPGIRMALEAGRRTKCASNLKSIGEAIIAEGLTPGGFPHRSGATGAETLAILYERDVIGEEEVFSCPGSGVRTADLESIRKDCGYAFRVGARTLPAGSKAVPIACDRSVDHHGDGMNVLYSDGRVVFEKRTELPEGLVE